METGPKASGEQLIRLSSTHEVTLSVSDQQKWKRFNARSHSGLRGRPSALSVFLVEVWWRKSTEEAGVQELGGLPGHLCQGGKVRTKRVNANVLIR